MRWFYLAIVIVLAAAVIIFAFQNLALVSVSFLGLSIGAPIAVVVLLVYVLGAVTGGSLFALLRRLYRASQIGL